MGFDAIPANQARSELLKSKAKQEMVEIGGRLAQTFGLPRSTGQIFGLLYFSSEPLSLMNMCHMLGISKASTSTGARQLVAWGAIRKVWVPGDRKDYYQAVEDFGEFLKGSYRSIIKPRIQSSNNRLNQIEKALSNDFKEKHICSDQHEHIKIKLARLKKLHGKLAKLIPIVEKLF